MKKTFLTALCAMFCLCTMAQKNVIFETDMGNDIDDAMAIDMLYKYHSMGKINLMAVMLNKEGMYPPMFIDLLNTWYGYKKLPIGVSNRESLTRDEDNFAKSVVVAKNEKGKPLYKRSIKDITRLPDAYKLHRKLLAAAPDHSVTIISVGFSTNLAKLLDSGADEFSPLSGNELIEKKVERLVTMAGYIAKPQVAEYNVANDIPACRKTYAEWPTEIVTSPFDVGMKILYPTSSLENDFKWTEHHPVVDACMDYLKGAKNRPTWDLTSVLWAIDPGTCFNLSPAGTMEVTPEGYTHFHEDRMGKHYYMITSPVQHQKILNYFLNMIPRNPIEFKKK